MKRRVEKGELNVEGRGEVTVEGSPTGAVMRQRVTALP